LDLLLLQVAIECRTYINHDRVIASPTQRPIDRLPSTKRDIPFGGLSAHQYSDPRTREQRTLCSPRISASPPILTSTSTTTPPPTLVWAPAQTPPTMPNHSGPRASPLFTMKFPCLVEPSTPPMRAPFRPTAPMSRPAESFGGFLNTQPAPGMASGCVSRR